MPSDDERSLRRQAHALRRKLRETRKKIAQKETERYLGSEAYLSVAKRKRKEIERKLARIKKRFHGETSLAPLQGAKAGSIRGTIRVRWGTLSVSDMRSLREAVMDLEETVGSLPRDIGFSVVYEFEPSEPGDSPLSELFKGYARLPDGTLTLPTIITPGSRAVVGWENARFIGEKIDREGVDMKAVTVRFYWSPTGRPEYFPGGRRRGKR